MSDDGAGGVVAVAVRAQEPFTAARVLPPEVFPRPTMGPSLDYVEFITIRQRLCALIRQPSQKKEQFLADLADAILAGEKEVPQSLFGFGLSMLRIAGRVKSSRRKREKLVEVAKTLLEKIYDPLLECSMTKKDILSPTKPSISAKRQTQ